MDRVSFLYKNYLNEVDRQEKTRTPTDGLLGMGNPLSKDPCHTRFAEELEGTLKVMAAEPVSPQEAAAALLYIYKAPLESKCHMSARWMLEAVHGLSIPLIKLTDCKQAAEILAWYEKAYSVFSRLPVQKQVVKELRKQAGISKK